MSQENVESLRQALDAVNRRDKAAWLTVCDSECENVPSREWPERAPIRGAEAIWDFAVEVLNAWDGAAFEWAEIVDAGGNKIVAHQRAEMRGKASGAGAVWSFWIVSTLRDGKVVRFEWFADRADALEAAGLSE